jgi:hypothetical protein
MQLSAESPAAQILGFEIQLQVPKPLAYTAYTPLIKKADILLGTFLIL